MMLRRSFGLLFSASVCVAAVLYIDSLHRDIAMLRSSLDESLIGRSRSASDGRQLGFVDSHPPVVRRRTASGWSVFGTIELLKLNSDGEWPIPPATNELYIEVGANNRDTLDEDVLPYHSEGFLMTFEPLHSSYSELISRFSRAKDRRKPLGWHHSRGIALPFAVAPAPERFAKFSLADVDGCSSLLQPNQQATYGRFCLQTSEVRTVPTITLRRVLALLPAGREVHHLKVDAQGADLAVVESAEELVTKIRHVQLEVTIDSNGCKPLQQDAPSCVETVRRMRALNFTAYMAGAWAELHRPWQHQGWGEHECTSVLPRNPMNGGTQCEADVYFHRADLGPPPASLHTRGSALMLNTPGRRPGGMHPLAVPAPATGPSHVPASWGRKARGRGAQAIYHDPPRNSLVSPRAKGG